MCAAPNVQTTAAASGGVAPPWRATTSGGGRQKDAERGVTVKSSQKPLVQPRRRFRGHRCGSKMVQTARMTWTCGVGHHVLLKCQSCAPLGNAGHCPARGYLCPDDQRAAPAGRLTSPVCARLLSMDIICKAGIAVATCGQRSISPHCAAVCICAPEVQAMRACACLPSTAAHAWQHASGSATLGLACSHGAATYTLICVVMRIMSGRVLCDFGGIQQIRMV